MVSEFNPFHNGHRYLLSQIPKKEGDTIVCIMSGSFVQRGEAAAYDKWRRAEAAIRGGADLVLELPVPFVLSDSDRFAAKGVETAAACGQPVTMAFGMESARLGPLSHLAGVPEEALRLPIKEGLCRGLSYGDARWRALAQLYPEESTLLKTPNNLLAFGYMRACLPRGIPYLGIRRTAPHDGAPCGAVASASYVRNHPEQFSAFCPFPQGPALDKALAERCLLTLLKTKTKEAMAQAANFSEGLENRFASKLIESSTLTEFFDRVKTKRYSHAKIRRAAMSAALGISASLPEQPVPYLRVLAFGKQGQALLKSLRKTASLPLLQTGRACEKRHALFFQAERLSTDLWNSWCPHPAPGGADYRKGAIYVSD